MTLWDPYRSPGKNGNNPGCRLRKVTILALSEADAAEGISSELWGLGFRV